MWEWPWCLSLLICLNRCFQSMFFGFGQPDAFLQFASVVPRLSTPGRFRHVQSVVLMSTSSAVGGCAGEDQGLATTSPTIAGSCLLVLSTEQTILVDIMLSIALRGSARMSFCLCLVIGIDDGAKNGCQDSPQT